MVDAHTYEESADADRWVRNTLLVRRWERMKDEILRHKWYESEKAGHDIGWERAAVDWMVRYGCRREAQPKA
jgi:hypothetical protein